MTFLVQPDGLQVENFRTFTKLARVNFVRQPGAFVVVVGLNEIEPDLGANGTGKSSVLDAICWCLFGKTVRGVRGPAVASWGMDGESTRVQFTFNHSDGNRYTVSRTQSPNSLLLFKNAPGIYADTSKVTGENIGPERIEKLIGLNYSLFLSTIVRGQFDSAFLDLTAKAKLDFLGEALDFQVWDTASANASSEKKQAQSELDELVVSESRIGGQVEEARASLTEAKAALDRAEGVYAKQNLDLKQRTAELDAKLSETQQQILERSASEASSKTLLQEAIETQNKAWSRVTEISKALAESKSAAALLDGKAQDAETASKDLDKVGAEGACPTCLSPICEETIQYARSVLTDRFQEIRKRRDVVQDQIQKDELRRQKIQAKVAAEVSPKITELTDKLDADREALAQLERKLLRLEVARESVVEIDTVAVTESRNSHAKAEARTKKLYKQATQVKEEVASARAKVERKDFWVKSFADIRLWLLRSALDDLEALVNSYTLSLGLRGWRVMFDVQRETKSGTMAKGFTAMILSPAAPEPAPYESWSGGEVQRLKIAVQTALSDLVRARRGGGWSWEAFDEPTQHLSAKGIQDLTEFLRNRAEVNGTEIWMIDHRTLSGGEFTHQLLVQKGPGGSKMLYKNR